MEAKYSNSQNDCMEKNNSLTKVFFVVFFLFFLQVVSHVRVVPGKAFFLSSLFPCYFTAMASYPLHFLPCRLPFSPFFFPSTLPFPSCPTSLLLKQVGAGGSMPACQHGAGSSACQSTFAFLNSSALGCCIPKSSDLHLGLGLCKKWESLWSDFLYLF